MRSSSVSSAVALAGREFVQNLGAARAVVRAHLIPTPLLAVDDVRLGPGALLKLESFQPTGSFKVRGALAAVARYGDEGAGIVTASAGNHGLGIAFAARRMDRRATVVVPTSIPRSKLAGLRELGVELMLADGGYEGAEAAAIELARTSGDRFVSAYSDPQVIAGQSTLLFEVAEAVAEPFQVVVPVGGGGLAAGTALAARALGGGITVIGVEAAASTAVSAAVSAGRVVPVTVGDTLADGLAGNLDPSGITPSLIGAHDVTMVSVTEAEIGEAIRHLAGRYGVIAEGSAAVGVAAALAGKIDLGRRTVFVITGRNIDPDRFAAILTAGHREPGVPAVAEP